MHPILLASLFSLLKITNLNYIDFRKSKPNVKFLKKFFFNAISLVLTKYFLKQISCFIGCKAFANIKCLFTKKTKLNKKKYLALKVKNLVI